ncbi:hypothetical protein SADUNF_Sadunf09G0089300 [Salix dunnii]|uniref:Uncharacterized protein n=1 Tax=Salix dunnii TaxID=1413687 RepID=A0A835N049_9ROSI|nr:hypothetical protein SADUNF_Sadunf09G0089300 [Salix dunnii]
MSDFILPKFTVPFCKYLDDKVTGTLTSSSSPLYFTRCSPQASSTKPKEEKEVSLHHSILTLALQFNVCGPYISNFNSELFLAVHNITFAPQHYMPAQR